MRGVFRQVVVGVSALLMAVTNTFFGERTAEVSGKYFTAFTPSDSTFAIWSVIFLGVLALAVYQALSSRRGDDRFDTLGLPLTVACLANAVWPFVWGGERLGLSVVIIVVMLLGLIWSFVAAVRAPSDRAFFWLTRVPVSLFFGWITAATILNICVWLRATGWTGAPLSAVTWAAAMLLIAGGIASFIAWRFREWMYGLVLIWATWGIVAAHPQTSPLLWSAVLSTAAILLGTVLGQRRPPSRAVSSSVANSPIY